MKRSILLLACLGLTACADDAGPGLEQRDDLTFFPASPYVDDEGELAADLPALGSMLEVPAGPFWMGCDPRPDNDCRDNEGPAHEVDVPAFEVDAYEVTVGEYRACVQAGGCEAPHEPPEGNAYAFYRDHLEDLPMNFVDWFEAEAYCGWAGKRLCTEAEWEKAARGGCDVWEDCARETPMYPWGDAEPSCELGAFAGCAEVGVVDPVGSKPAGASAYGVLDMAGSVSEWVADVGYSGDPLSRGLRGSTFEHALGVPVYDAEIHVSFRGAPTGASRGPSKGFRCCR